MPGGEGVGVLRAEDMLERRQQSGEQGPGGGRVARLPGPTGEVGATVQGVRVLRTEDAAEGPRAFVEKRKPNWQCR